MKDSFYSQTCLEEQQQSFIKFLSAVIHLIHRGGSVKEAK